MELRELLFGQYGETTEKIMTGYACVRPVTLRINTLKLSVEEGKARLRAEGRAYREVPWYDAALILENGEKMGEDALFLSGEVYLQSLSSMLPPLYLNVAAGETVLDMAAAPGGKTTQICALTCGKALVTACERDKLRFERLKFNLERQGATRVTALHTDAGALDEFFSFDKILLDAPCSGSGTVHDLSRARIDGNFVKKCADRQYRLLRKAVALLKAGGEVVYSTCSVLREENDEIVERVLRETDTRLVPLSPFGQVPLLPSLPGAVCICPSELYEGFFVAKLKKAV